MLVIPLLMGLLFLPLWFSEEAPPPLTAQIKTDTALGRHLFHDPILSLDQSISCASCHIPEFAFADTAAFSLGVGGQRGVRNTPASMNMLARSHFFYDGRSATLQEQVIQPIINPIEMALPVEEAVKRLRNSAYNNVFLNIYGAHVDSALLGEALAAFVFTLESPGDSPFDRWMNDDTTAMTAQAIRGRELFINKAKCFDCHFSPDFTADEFKNIGLYNGTAEFDDVGRFAITKDSADLGKMKVPGLRNVAVTAPYMHNGMFETLEEVVDYYDNPYDFVSNPINIDTLMIEPLGLTDEEKAAIVAFLESLTDERYQEQLQ